MRLLLIILLPLLTGCAGKIIIKWTDPTTLVQNSIDYTSMRRAVITIDKDGVAVMTGQIAISDETAQVLIGEVGSVAKPVPDFTRQPTIHRRTIVHQTRAPTDFNGVRDKQDF